MARILLIEDEELIGQNVRDALTYHRHDVEWVTDGLEGYRRALAEEPDLVLLDIKLPNLNGMDILKNLKAENFSGDIIIMTAHGDVDMAVEAMKEGAADFITKSGRLRELDLILQRVLKNRTLAERLEYFHSRERAHGALSQIIGDSRPMTKIKEQIRRLVEKPVIASDSPPTVLITGETGTGKDMVARALHFEGPRQAESFVYVNCAAIPDNLFESELFGHVKGAFTDAHVTKKGMFELADQGTIFLDEIGHLPLHLQAKLLTAIEQKHIRPVGGAEQRAINVHVIAATNRDLEQAVRQNEFRGDLYHRLRVVTFELPPLRRRLDDLDALVPYFVAMYAKKAGVSVKGVSSSAMEMMRDYDWPGNVRELAHALESAVLMLDGPTLLPEHLPLKAAGKRGGVIVQIDARRQITLDFAAGQPTLEEVEYRVIDAALEYSKHNVSRAARVLGMTRDALRYRLQKRENTTRVESPSSEAPHSRWD